MRFLARMKIFPADNNVGWLALLGLLALVLGNSTATQPIAEKEQTPSVPRQGDGAFRSCAALTAGREGPIAFGQGPIVTFLGAISCGTPVEIHIEDGEVLLRAGTSLDTTGIYFTVHPGATLTLQAPTISIKGISDNDHERSHPLFTVEGRLVLDATSSLPVIAKSKNSWLEDRHGIMSLSSKAIVDSGQTVFYDKNSVNVGRVPADEEAIKSVDLPPDPADALAESHADLTARRITALTTDDDTQPASPMASADRILPPSVSSTDTARPSSSPAAAADAGAKEPTTDHDDRDDATTTPTHPATTDAAADGSTTPKAGSVFSAPAALSPREANANDHAHAHAASLGEVSDDGDAHLTKLNGVVQSCDDLPAAFSRGVMTLVDDLICPRAKVVVISGDATIRSESDILTKDIFWVVQPGVSVTFEAPTVTLVRGSKMDRRPVLSVGAGGFVHFRVNERLPSSWGNSLPASPMASADRNLPPGDSGTDSARPSSSPAAAADAGAKEPTPDQADRDDATTTPTHPATTDAAADGSTTPKAGSVFSAPAALSPHEANANDHAHAHAASLGEVSDDGDAHLTKLNGVVQSCDDLPAAFSRGVMTLVDDLICPRAKVVVISGDAIIRSESDILTKDIFWVVQPGVSVTFEAPTVTLVRGSKMDRRPVLSVGAGGFVHFRVNERLPSSWGNSLEQQHGFVVFLVDEGVRVRFHAPMVTSSQEKLFLSQAEDVPVLFIDCQALIRVSVHDWTPAVSERISEDKSGLVNTQEEDFLESAVMRAGNCSDDAIAAAEPVDGGGSEESTN
eukprot:g13492.t1